jgi:rare lipoprotein A
MRFMPISIVCIALLQACGSQPDKPSPMGSPSAAMSIRPGYKVGVPYTIKGVRYTPRESFDMVEVGIASWYGPGFHGRLTANGEVYDQRAMTAAHRTLQLPAVVRVTNLDNGRSIVLRVNDRGPFVGDRVIDLSEGAADALGARKQGLANVRVEVMPDESRQVAALARNRETVGTMETLVAGLNSNQPGGSSGDPSGIPGRGAILVASDAPVSLPPSQPRTTAGQLVAALPPSTPSSADVGTWFLQAGAFQDPNNADRARDRLRHVGPTAVVPRPQGGRTLYLVRVGPYGTKERAESVLERVREVGFDGATMVGAG